MKVLDDHHLYELENHEHPVDVPPQTLQFIKKEPAGDGFPPGSLITVAEGTTNEEVLRVLIHRLTEMGKNFPCRENSIAITKLDEALLWLEKRTADRKARGVEGKAIA